MKIKRSHNQALHQTAIPLRFIAAGELFVRPACGGANAELSCALPICPRRRRRREQIVGADKIACITSHFVPVIQAILQLNSAFGLQ